MHILVGQVFLNMKIFLDIYTHISMSLSVYGFNIWLNAETMPAINRLKKNIERDPLTFYNLLKSLVERGYYIQLFERERIENEPLPEKWPWFTVIVSEYSDTPTLIFLYGRLMELKYPVLNIGMRLDIRSSEDRELLMSKKLVDLIVNVISDLTLSMILLIDKRLCFFKLVH